MTSDPPVSARAVVRRGTATWRRSTTTSGDLAVQTQLRA